MSTIALAAPAPIAVRLTRRGRLLLTLTFLAAALVMMVSLSGLATATHDSGTPTPVRVVEVHEGDTLYGLASSIAEPGHIREAVHEIAHLNNLEGGVLQAGDRIAIPLH